MSSIGMVLLFLKILKNIQNHSDTFEKSDREELKQRPKGTLRKRAITQTGNIALENSSPYLELVFSLSNPHLSRARILKHPLGNKNSFFK